MTSKAEQPVSERERKMIAAMKNFPPHYGSCDTCGGALKHYEGCQKSGRDAAIRSAALQAAADEVRGFITARDNLEHPFQALNWCAHCKAWKDDLVIWNGGPAYFKSCRHDEGDTEAGVMHELGLLADRILKLEVKP